MIYFYVVVGKRCSIASFFELAAEFASIDDAHSTNLLIWTKELTGIERLESLLRRAGLLHES